MEEKFNTLDYCVIPVGDGTDFYVELSLNRPDQANALNQKMLDELAKAFSRLHKTSTQCRLLVVKGLGKHFCSGADLEWMRDASRLSKKQNLQDAHRLTQVFNGLWTLPMPTITVVHGAVYGGALGLTCASDFSLAENTASFCLSEVKWGLAPAVIYPFLKLKLHPGQLQRLVLTARLTTAEEALQFGLVEEVFSPDEKEKCLKQHIQQILQADPSAIRAFKKQQKKHIQKPSTTWKMIQENWAQLIANLRTSVEGQAGLNAFLNKKSPPWKITELPPR